MVGSASGCLSLELLWLNKGELLLPGGSLKATMVSRAELNPSVSFQEKTQEGSVISYCGESRATPETPSGNITALHLSTHTQRLLSLKDSRVKQLPPMTIRPLKQTPNAGWQAGRRWRSFKGSNQEDSSIYGGPPGGTPIQSCQTDRSQLSGFFQIISES